MAIREFVDRAKNELLSKVYLLQEPDINVDYLSSLLMNEFFVLGVGEWVLLKDVNKLKKYFGCLAILLNYIEDWSRFYSKPTKEVLSLFLSERHDLISKYVNYPFVTASRDSYSGSVLIGPMIVAVYLLRGNETDAKEEYYRWVKGSSYKKGLLFYHHLDLFFEGLLNKNEDTIKAGINKILEPHNLKFYIDEYGPWEEEFSTMANFCGKLAWMLGNEIEFENKQIVMDLVRIDPLDKYPTIEDIKREFT